MRFGLLALALIPAVLTACQFKKNGDDDKVSAKDVKQVIDQRGQLDAENAAAVLTNDNVSIRFVPETEPKKYRLEIRWPVSVPRLAVSLNGQVQGEYSKGQFSRSFAHGASVEVRLDSKNSQGHIVSTVSDTLKAPFDLVISEFITLQQDEQWVFGRIFILPGMTIYTQGYNLELRANEIHAPDAHVRTFVDTSPTASKRELSNGLILFQAKKLIGRLDLRMSGRDGADGLSGIDKVTAAMPKAGVNGQDGRNSAISSKDSFCPGGPSIRMAACLPQVVCSVPATPGTNGTDGANGLSGDDGANGGNTGSVTFLVEDSSDAKVDIFLRVGEPGKGGVGQEGYPGGKGGRGGQASVHGGREICPAGANGADGKNGVRGADGKPGEPGQVGECILPPGEPKANFRVFRE